MVWKLLFTVGIVFLVWMVFKKISLANRPGHESGGPGRESRVDRIRRAAEEAVKAKTGQQEPVKTVELIQCPSCGNYVAPGATCNCGWKQTD